MYIPEFPTLSPAHLINRQIPKKEMPFPLSQQNALYFYLARNGIYHLFKQKRLTERDTVLVPDYHHGNEIRAILTAGWKVKYYHINWNFTFSIDELTELIDKDVKAVLAIHYMGWPQHLADLRQFCNDHGLWLFEDCALSFLAEIDGAAVGRAGDYAVFCLYKFLPVPNGAVLTGKDLENLSLSELIKYPGRLSTLARSIQLGLDFLRLQSGKQLIWVNKVKEIAGSTLNLLQVKRTAVGDSGFNRQAADLGMSPFSQRILQKIDYAKIRESRRRNFHILQELFDGNLPIVLNSLADGACPLFFPILVKDKSKFVARMRKRGIGAVPFWNQGHPTAIEREGEPCRFFRKHLVELPLHQDLTPDHMEYIALSSLQESNLLLKELPKN